MGMENYNHGIQVILACLVGERDALEAWRDECMQYDGEEAAFRMNLLNLVIENLDTMVIQPLMRGGHR